MKRAAVPLALALLAVAPAEASGGHSCREDAPVVVLGRRRCGRFGRWDVSPEVSAFSPTLGLETDWHRLLLARRTIGATLTVNDKVTTFDIAGSKIGLPRTDLAAGRFALEYVYIGPVRLGWVVEIGGNGVTGQTFAVPGQTFSVQGTFYSNIGLNAAAGLTAGRFVFRGEVLAADQTLHLDTLSDAAAASTRVPGVHPMLAPGGGSGAGLDLRSARLHLAPRASVEVWTSDYLTLGIAGAVDVIYRDDFMLGGFLRGYFYKRGYHDPRVP